MSGNGVRQPALLLQHQSKIVVAGRIVWSQRDILPKQPFGPSAWRKSVSGVLDGPATPVFWNMDKSE